MTVPNSMLPGKDIASREEKVAGLYRAGRTNICLLNPAAEGTEGPAAGEWRRGYPFQTCPTISRLGHVTRSYADTSRHGRPTRPLTSSKARIK